MRSEEITEIIENGHALDWLGQGVGWGKICLEDAKIGTIKMAHVCA